MPIYAAGPRPATMTLAPTSRRCIKHTLDRYLPLRSSARYTLPAIYAVRDFADEGGLMAYGSDVIDNYRRAASYVDQILKGANPANLPVQAQTKFGLVINLKTAKALGLTVPPSLLDRADEVIE